MSSPFSISGLSSGLDWQSMIDKLMSIEQRPIQLLQTRQSTLRSQKQAWMDVNNRLANLQVKMNALKLESTFLGHKTSVSDESSLKAIATADASNGMYHVTVNQLATKSSRESTGDIGAPLDSTVAMAMAGFAKTITEGTVTINGKQYSIAPESDSLDDFAAALAADGITLAYDDVNDVLSLSSATALSLGSATDSSNFLEATRLAAELVDGSTSVNVNGLGAVQWNQNLVDARFRTALTATDGSFSINNVTIAWDANTDSLKEVIERINRSEAGVTARYDSYSDTVTLESNRTGNRDIVLADGQGGLLAALNLTDSSLVRGQNASITVAELNDGQPISSTENRVEIVNGLTLDLLKADPLSEIKVEVTSDTSSAVSAIRAFVDQYNSAQDFIAGKLDTGDPLNPNDGGILAGNPTLIRIQSTLRRLVSSKFAGASGIYQSLDQIGISTSSDKTARLVLDESKLSEALLQHADDVRRLFFDEVNIALSSHGGSVSVSSEFDAQHPGSTVIDGITSSSNWGNGQGWMDGTAGVFPDTLTLSFGSVRTIEKVIIHTVNSSLYPAAFYGIADYTLTARNGVASVELAGVTGNTNGTITSFVKSTRADSLEISISASNDGQYSRIVEVEVFEFAGLAAELDRQIQSLIRSGDGIITTQQNGLQRTIDDMTAQMDKMERRIQTQRETLTRKFVAMETALSQMQSQSLWLNSQLAGLQNNWLNRE